MDTKIKNLLNEIEKIENRLIDNINNMDNNNELNDKLIELISKYPEQKELVKFIVFINDNLTNSQIKARDIVIDSLSSILEQKRNLLKIMEELHIKKPSKSTKKLLNFKELPMYGWITISLISISFLTFLFLMAHPDKTDTIAKAAVEITNKKVKK